MSTMEFIGGVIFVMAVFLFIMAMIDKDNHK